MKISVVIPTFNHATYLPEAIKSALGQTLKPHEVIVVDDGSTDHTPEIASRYPVISLRQAREGPSSARNHGIQIATGEWVALLDGDDYWLPRKLELQASAIRDEGLCYCGVTRFYEDGSRRDVEYCEVPRVRSVLRHHNCLDTSAVLIRRDAVLAAGGFNEHIRAGEDWEMWLKLSRGHKFVGIPDRLVMYRVTGTGLSMDPGPILGSRECIVSAGTADLTPVRRFIAARRMRSVRTALAALKYRDLGDHRNTLRYAWEAFRHWPSPFYDKACKILLLELFGKVRVRRTIHSGKT